MMFDTMELQPDFVLEKDKSDRLPRALNFATILNKCPLSIGIEINHNKFQDPIITLLPVTKNANVVGGD